MSSVADFLIERLENVGIKHVFGIPGDYVLNLYKKFSDHKSIDIINTTDESHAGFAADAYARIHGVGAVCVTYNVGGLKLANSVACAYAEKSPLIVICGSPGIKERQEDALLHHMVRSFDCQRKMFQKITCASIVLDNPNRAGYDIDRAISMMNYYKQPIYIELPRDIADKSISYDVYKQGTPKQATSDKENLSEAISEVVSWIKEAENPVILAGVELARFGLGNELLKFAEKSNIPICTTLLSKSVVSETHPLFSGIYMGGCSKEGVQELVENSDCLLMFGVMLTDMTLGFMPSKFQKRQTVQASIDGLKVKNHSYEKIVFSEFCSELFKIEGEHKRQNYSILDKPEYIPDSDKEITTVRLFEKINSILTEDMAIVADIGDSLFGAADLSVKDKNHFVSPAFYTSMGNAIPGALGVQTARPKVRPIVVVGDGAFQMSCTELSTIVHRGLNPIVFVLNNNGFTTERFLLDGPFNDVHPWNYEKIIDMIGGGKGVKVLTEGDLEEALDIALDSKELFVINVKLKDTSNALQRMTKGLAKKV